MRAGLSLGDITRDDEGGGREWSHLRYVRSNATIHLHQNSCTHQRELEGEAYTHSSASLIRHVSRLLKNAGVG